PARIALSYALFLDWGWDYPGLAPDAVLDRGFAAADRALGRDSSSADAWMARGFLLSFRNPRRFTGVEDAFQRATALDSVNAETYHQFGMMRLWLGQDSAAAVLYHRALAIDPERAITLFNLARVRMRRRDYRGARHWLDSALTVDPGADYAYVLRALAHLRLGERAEARADGETAVRLRAGYRLPGEAVLVLDLALSDPALLNGTVQPWSDEGYAVEYRRFYPHLARADLGRYRVLLFLLGREPEAPSDALTAGDLALLTEWVLQGGVVVLGYDADGEGYLDRWTVNRWLEFAGTGISIGDRLLEDTTVHTATTTGRQQPWVEARTLGDEPLGSVFDPFPLDRNNVLATRDSSQLLALTSRHAFVRAPRTPAPRPRAGVAAAARIGDGLVVVISRHALGALGPQFRPTTAPVEQLDALERTASSSMRSPAGPDARPSGRTSRPPRAACLSRWGKRPLPWSSRPRF